MRRNGRQRSSARIVAGIKELGDAVSGDARFDVQGKVVQEVERLLNSRAASAGTSNFLARVAPSEGCLGKPGGGISVTDGDTTVTGCVIAGSGGGIEGGGVEVSVSC